jgi:hypothetical protein
MAYDKRVFDAPVVIPGETTPRSAAQLAEKERTLARQRALDSLTAWDATPAERIRRWEDLHALALPPGAAHPLVAVIVAHTKLTLDDIRDEQQRRRAISQTTARTPTTP